MLVFKYYFDRCKYFMRLAINFVVTVLFLLLTVQVSHAQAVTLMPETVEGELYTKTTHPELYCMAKNIYFEAKSELEAGQYAVADVVLNRVADSRFPNSICEVVYEGIHRESWKTKQHADLADHKRIYIPKRHQCQFSWYCDGKSDKIKDGDAWRKSQEIAYRIVRERKFRGVTQGSTHYHATYVSPKWAPELNLIGRIGTHIFYRWR